jgi:hypothetical protein
MTGWTLRFCRFELKLPDLWIGAFWRRSSELTEWDPHFCTRHIFDLWICAIPCLPLHCRWERVKDMLDDTKIEAP